MEVPGVVNKLSVLVVDQSDETREVLRTVLARRGAEVWEATQADAALVLAREHRPDVIVLDLEIAESASESVRAELGDPDSAVAPIVLLGTARRAEKDFPAGQFVPKPYDYGPLVRKIEGLLDQVRRREGPAA